MSISCTSGQMLSGPSTSTCMGNGEWEPDLREVACVDASTTLSQEGKFAVASSVTVFVVTSLLFFIIGYLSRRFCRRESGKTADSEAVKDEISIYDDIELKQQEHELDLKENAAYVPVQ